MIGSLAQAAQRLGGEVVGRQLQVPGPGHSPKDRSLSVQFVDTAPDGFCVFSHAGDDVGRCRDHVRARLGLPQWQPQGRRETVYNIHDKSARAEPDDGAKIARAAELWAEAVDPTHTLVATYLASRGRKLPAEVAGAAIRYHRGCPWRDEASGRTIRVPAMVAAMRNATTKEITAVHRTKLSADGRKLGRRMLGRAGDSAIMLFPMVEGDDTLTVGEGIETVLAGAQMGWRPAWAMGSVGGIASLPVLPGVRHLEVFGENGCRANERAIDAVGERYADAGREVAVVMPRHGKDMNDALRGSA